MIEIFGRIFISILFEGIILGFFKLIVMGFNKLGKLIFGNKKPMNSIRELNKNYLYKEIELTENLNEKLKLGQTGVVVDIIDMNKVFAEFFDKKGKQIECNGEFVFEIEMSQFMLKK